MRICEAPDCDNEFERHDKRVKFCGHACSARVSNKARAGRRYKTGEPIIERECLRCGSAIKRLAPITAKYCSKTCGAKHRSESYIGRWLLGEESGGHASGGLKAFVRTWLIEEAGHRCTSSSCSTPGGWGIPNPKTGKPILAIEHLDGNWKNNIRTNLKVLCYNCHTLSETFGSLNAGSPSGTRPGSGLRTR